MDFITDPMEIERRSMEIIKPHLAAVPGSGRFSPGRCIFCLILVGQILTPDPGALLAVAVKPVLRSLYPAFNRIVHDVIDLSDGLPVRLSIKTVTLVVNELRTDVIVLEAVKPCLDHAGAGIFSHEVHSKDPDLMLHLRRELQ